MIAFRICRERFADAATVLAGHGARDAGGRWNAVGIPAVYASENSSLAILEMLARVDLRDLPRDSVLVRIDVPDAPATRIRQSDLPADWRTTDNPECARLGSAWLAAKSELVLRVPSATNPFEENVILNPLHPRIAECTVAAPAAVRYDPRFESLLERFD